MINKKIRFLFLRALANIFLIVAAILLLVVIGPYLKDELLYHWHQFWGIKFGLEGEASTTLRRIEPASRDFGIVIEKINLNAPIVKNVSVTNEAEYKEALQNGVAHAKGSALPGEPGVFYLFAHSSVDFWALGKYATVFNLLPKMEVGDSITIFYQGKEYRYKVTKKEIVRGFATKFLNPAFNRPPLLVLQTCYPIGTTLNRLLITASFVDTS